MASFLMTGGSGFLGYHVATRIFKDRHSLRIFDLTEPRYPLPDGADSEWVAGDVTDSDALVAALDGIDYVVHLAGILGTAETVADPLPSLLVNTTATVQLFEMVRDRDIPMVLTVNGNHEWFNTYAITKEAAGRLAIMFNREFGTRIAVVRAFNAFGEWQKDRPVRKIVPDFVRRALSDEPIEIFGSGLQEFDLVYAGDVAEVLYRAVSHDHGEWNDIFEAGSGEVTTSIDAAELVIDLCGSSSKLEMLPMRPGEPEMSHIVADLTTLDPLGFRPDGDIRENLVKTIEWYRGYFATLT